MVFIKYAFPAKVNSRDTAGLRSPLAAALSMCETPLRGHQTPKPSADGTARAARKPMSLKKLAEHLALSPATVSWSSIARASPIPSRRPPKTESSLPPANSNIVPISLPARSAPAQFYHRCHCPEVSDGYSASVMSGVEDYLLQEGYFYFVASHRHRADLIDEYPRMFLDAPSTVSSPSTPLESQPLCARRHRVRTSRRQGVTNIVLNHQRAAELALKHLFHLGHRKIAFIKGQEFSSDTEERWANIERVARRIGLTIDARLVAQLEGDSPSPQLGYMATKVLLASRQEFTACSPSTIFRHGLDRALHESGCHVPKMSPSSDSTHSKRRLPESRLDHRSPALARNGPGRCRILLKRINRPGSELRDKLTLNPNSSYEKPQAPPRETAKPCQIQTLVRLSFFHTISVFPYFRNDWKRPNVGSASAWSSPRNA